MFEPSKEMKEKAIGRQKYLYEGREIYEWDQTLDDVNIYIKPPKACLKKYEEQVRSQLKPGETIPKLEVKIKPKQLTVGIKGLPPFLNQELEKLCDSDESVWMIEDEELHIILQKAFKGELWPCVIKGHQQIDPFTEGELQKKLMLERFQQEHPTFDFSQATFNGQAPNPREFMGGIKYN